MMRSEKQMWDWIDRLMRQLARSERENDYLRAVIADQADGQGEQSRRDALRERCGVL